MITGNDLLRSIGSGYSLQNHHLLDQPITQFSVDSRSVTIEGALFAAITLEENAPATETVWFNLKAPIDGFYFDHHKYIEGAISNGARFILCQVLPTQIDPNVAYIVVPNVIKTLGQLASSISLKENAKVIAVTGSSGKTSTVEAIYTMLKRVEENTGKVYTQRPNPVSISLGVLNLYCGTLKENALLIVEMPTDHHGCIAALAKVVQPDIAVVLNIRDAHVNIFGSLDAIAHAKSEIVKALKADGIMVLNQDDEKVRWMGSLATSEQKVLYFGESRQSDVRGEVTTHKDTSIVCHVTAVRSSSDFEFPLIGSTSLYIPLAAIAVGIALGYPLAELTEGVSQFKSMPGRMDWSFRMSKRLRIFDNAEKCNAVNLRQLLQSISDAKWQGHRVMVLGNFDSAEHIDMSATDWRLMCTLFDSIIAINPGTGDYLLPLLTAQSGLNISVMSVGSVQRATAILDRLIEEVGGTIYVCLAAMKSKQDITPVVEYLKENYAE